MFERERSAGDGIARRCQVLALLALTGLGLACSGSSSTTAVQAGGTLSIPLASEFTRDGLASVSPVGYGGTFYDDAQRGQLVFVTETGGYVFETLYTVFADSTVRRADPPPFLNPIDHSMLVVLVKVPLDVAPGTYELDLYHVPPGGDPTQPLVDGTLVDPPYPGHVTVLPPETDLGGNPIDPSPPETWVSNWDAQTGQYLQSPTSYFDPAWAAGIGLAATFLAPSPGIRVWAEAATPDPSRLISSYSVDVDFSQALGSGGVLKVVNLRGVAKNPATDLAWFDPDPVDPAKGVVNVVSLVQGEEAGEAWVLFDLDPTLSEPVVFLPGNDPSSEVFLTLAGAADQYGDASLEGDVGVALYTLTEIR